MFIIRSGPPSKYDECRYGSVCKSIKSMHDEFEIHVQISHDEQHPQWESVGIFSTKTKDLVAGEINKILSMKQVR